MNKIIITVAPAGKGRFDAFVDNQYQLTSTSPFIDVCRVLIAHGVDPETPAAMRHVGSDHDALRGRVGAVAGLGVRGDRIIRAAGPTAPPPMRSGQSCRPLLARVRPNG